MKRKNRLTRNEDFKKVIRAHKNFANKSFSLSYLKNELGLCRIGITISGKYGNAVQRNKAKRQTRMMIQKLFDLNLPVDCVVFIRKDFKDKDFAHNESELSKLYQKLKKRGDMSRETF